MTVVPAEMAVMKPAETVATEGAEEVHVSVAEAVDGVRVA
jgi:hypothetical protein